MNEPRAIAILGMHRSGTSALTGCLKDAGVYLGPVAERSRYNAKGNQENTSIWRLHDALLEQCGGTWYRPPARMQWDDQLRAQRDQIIADYAGHEPWAFKDPRTLLALDGWLEALPDLALIASVRNPVAVARSLEARDGFRIAYEDGLELWRIYNQRLLDLLESRPVPLVSFDHQGDDYQQAVHRALAAIGIEAPPRLMFFDAELQHHPRAPTEDEVNRLPSAVRALHEALVSRSL